MYSTGGRRMEIIGGTISLKDKYPRTYNRKKEKSTSSPVCKRVGIVVK